MSEVERTAMERAYLKGKGTFIVQYYAEEVLFKSSQKLQCFFFFSKLTNGSSVLLANHLLHCNGSHNQM